MSQSQAVDGRSLRTRVASARRHALALTTVAWHWLVAVTAEPRRRARPVTAVVSPTAWVLSALVIAGVAAGFSLQWTELIFGSLFVLFLLAICVPFVLGGHDLGAELDLTRDRVVVGERANGRLLITNGAGHRTVSMLIELAVGTARADFELPSLAAHSEHEELFAIPTQRRAILDVGPVRAVRADPFLLLTRDQELSDVELLHVHPRTVRVEGSASGFVRDLEGQTVRKLSDSDVAFHALRAYVAGDDRRYVHWKTSARTGTLMVRQFEETRRSHLLVALSTRLGDYATDDEFELAVSVAGSLGVQSLRDGQTLSAATSIRRLRATHPTPLLDQLSGVDFEAEAPRMSETFRRLGRDVSDASVAVIVCGSLVDTAELRRARRHLGSDVRTIVVRADPGATLQIQSMADIDVTTLGVLDELPGVMRRLS